MEEVLAPEPEGVQEIIYLYRPLIEANPRHITYTIFTLLRMPVTVRAEEKGEEYVISAPASTSKEDLLQMVEDGMLV